MSGFNSRVSKPNPKLDDHKKAKQSAEKQPEKAEPKKEKN